MTSPDVNPAAAASLEATPPPMVRAEHAEGHLARLIEQQAAKIPSDWFLFGAAGSMALALVLELSGRPRASQFVSRWPTPVLVAGVYNKIVKTLGTR